MNKKDLFGFSKFHFKFTNYTIFRHRNPIIRGLVPGSSKKAANDATKAGRVVYKHLPCHDPAPAKLRLGRSDESNGHEPNDDANDAKWRARSEYAAAKYDDAIKHDGQSESAAIYRTHGPANF